MVVGEGSIDDDTDEDWDSLKGADKEVVLKERSFLSWNLKLFDLESLDFGGFIE